MTLSSAALWLRGTSIITVAVGLVAAAASSAEADGPWLLLFDVLQWPLDGEPARFTSEGRALNAVLGGVMVGWGTLMYLVADGPLRRGDTALAAPVLIGVVTWFVVDSTGSMFAGLPGNVILNAGFLVLFLPPLVALRRAHLAAGSVDRGQDLPSSRSDASAANRSTG